MKRLFSLVALALPLIGFSEAAYAQWAVIDAGNIAQSVQTVKNTLAQLEEAKRMYNTINSLSQIRSFSQALQNPILQSALPSGITESVNLISSDLAELGALGQRAQSLVDLNDFSTGGVNGSLGSASEILTKSAATSARDQAYGEYMLEASTATGKGLTELSNSLSTATTTRQSQDIASRANIENAAVNNRILQMYAADEAARGAAALQANSNFAAQQRKTKDNIASGALWPTWHGVNQ